MPNWNTLPLIATNLKQQKPITNYKEKPTACVRVCVRGGCIGEARELNLFCTGKTDLTHLVNELSMHNYTPWQSAWQCPDDRVAVGLGISQPLPTYAHMYARTLACTRIHMQKCPISSLITWRAFIITALHITSYDNPRNVFGIWTALTASNISVRPPTRFQKHWGLGLCCLWKLMFLWETKVPI